MIIKRIGRAISHAFKNPRILGAYYRRYLPPVKLMVCGIVFLPLKMLLYKKDIWLICEKITEARDNGYHFFKYVKENHPEVNAYYVIAKGSPDSEKVNHYGNIVAANPSGIIYIAWLQKSAFALSHMERYRIPKGNCTACLNVLGAKISSLCFYNTGSPRMRCHIPLII